MTKSDRTYPDSEPDYMSSNLELCKDLKGNVYLHKIVLAGWNGVDFVVEDQTFGLKVVVPELAAALRQFAYEKLRKGERHDVTAMCAQFHAEKAKAS